MRASRFYHLKVHRADMGAQFIHEGVLDDLLASGQNQLDICALDDIQTCVV